MFDITIITGMSGAGRSETANVLEDLGYFVIDNLPPELIGKVAELASGSGQVKRYALVVDVRSGAFVEALRKSLEQLHEQQAETRVIFLEANDDTLVRRFGLTRRPHPLADAGSALDGIQREREMLADLREQADLVVDTSGLNVHELRDRIGMLLGERSPEGAMHTNIVSFGYKHGVPLDVDLVFDCRLLPNPHWVEKLRPLPGTDPAVRDYVLSQPDTEEFLQRVTDFLAFSIPKYAQEHKAYLTIGVGCTGGRHRSVVISEEIAQVLRGMSIEPRVHHRDVNRA